MRFARADGTNYHPRASKSVAHHFANLTSPAFIACNLTLDKADAVQADSESLAARSELGLGISDLRKSTEK